MVMEIAASAGRESPAWKASQRQIDVYDASRLVNKLVLDATCPISKETDFKKSAVKVVRA